MVRRGLRNKNPSLRNNIVKNSGCEKSQHFFQTFETYRNVKHNSQSQSRSAGRHSLHELDLHFVTPPAFVPVGDLCVCVLYTGHNRHICLLVKLSSADNKPQQQPQIPPHQTSWQVASMQKGSPRAHWSVAVSCRLHRDHNRPS